MLAAAPSALLERSNESLAVGPAAARCLALLCHATPSPALGVSPLVLGLTPLSANLSALIGSWISAAYQAPGATYELIAEVGGAADCASAALQLLGGAAEAQPELFQSLFRGCYRANDTVRVRP